MAPSIASTSELQRFDNAEQVPRDIMRNGFEHALRAWIMNFIACRLPHVLYVLYITTLTLSYKFDSDAIQKIITCNIFEALTWS